SSANAAARFSVVVVLATPPFWLANAMTFAFPSTVAPMLELRELAVRWVFAQRPAIPARQIGSADGRCPARRRARAPEGQARLHLRGGGRSRQDDHRRGARAGPGGTRSEGCGRDDRPRAAARERAGAKGARRRARARRH